LTTTLAAPASNTQQVDDEVLKALSKLYDIDIETQPNDGTVKGIRIRRHHGSEGVGPWKTADLNLPEIDIQKINDQMLSVNSVRMKRNNLADLSDVELEKDIQAEASEVKEDEADDRSRRSGSGLESILGFLGAKITQKLSALAGASSGGSSGSDDHHEDSYGHGVSYKNNHL